MKKHIIISILAVAMLSTACTAEKAKYENPAQNFEGNSERIDAEISHPVPE